jgi:ribosomal protein L11 methyltransferase
MAHTHLHVRITETDPARIDLLIGRLTQAGFEGFQVDDDGLDAYLPTPDPKVDEWHIALQSLGIEPERLEAVEERNWNAEWESSFQPVRIPGRLSVRADFHPPVDDAGIALVITPKMSFGTGHHDTTVLMMEDILDNAMHGKSVLDFGTGTGILAILAEKCGANRVLALDNDPWSIDNAQENILGNDCRHIVARLADTLPGDETFDIVLANINRNVILQHVDAFRKVLKPGGRLLLSGLLADDLPDIRNAFPQPPFAESTHAIRNRWARISFYANSE